MSIADFIAQGIGPSGDIPHFIRLGLSRGATWAIQTAASTSYSTQAAASTSWSNQSQASTTWSEQAEADGSVS